MRALITGANRGIGNEMFAQMQARSDDVIGTTRGKAPDAHWLRLDISSEDSLRKMAASLNNTPLDLLVCNAGVYLDKGHTLDTGFGSDIWANSFTTNVTGVFRSIQTLLPNIRAAKGKIAIISSLMASQEQAPGGSYAYRASKAAALNIGRNLAVDLKDHGVSVGIYHPGWVQTDMGGKHADITAQQAASGLIARFDALSLKTTGCFETWDGRPIAF
ncbi:MAG: SDR family NAD(P)-dependent oxidoreductase [Litoreibacter sp.]